MVAKNEGESNINPGGLINTPHNIWGTKIKLPSLPICITRLHFTTVKVEIFALR